MKKVSINVGNQQIRGTLLIPENQKNKNPAVLLIHGWASSEKSHIPRAQAISDFGYICLTFNLRGHGDSDGKLEEFSRKDHLEDCIAAYDYLSSLQEVDSNNISVVGSSYGGYLAVLLAEKRNIKSLVLRGPALYPDIDFDIPTAEIIKRNPHVFQQSNLLARNNHALKILLNYQGKVLLVESEKDDIVPMTTTRNYVELANQNLLTHKIIKDADHVLSKEEWQKEYIEILKDWFRDSSLRCE